MSRQNPQLLDEVTEVVCTLASLISGTLPAEIPPLPALYRHFEIEPESSNSKKMSEVTTALSKRVADCLLSTDTQGVSLQDIANRLVVLHHADGREVTKPLRLILVIIDCLGTQRRSATKSPLRSQDDWKTALSLARDRERIVPIAPDPLNETHRDRYRSVGTSARALREAGFSVDLVGTQAQISSGTEAQIATRLRDDMRQLGGLRYVHGLFGVFSRAGLFDEDAGRYSLIRSPGGVGTGYTKQPRRPFGYLLNLAASNCLEEDSSLSSEELRALAEKLEALARHWTVLYNVEPYSQFEQMFVSGNDLLDYLSELVIYDGIFPFPQASPRTMAPTILELLGSEDTDAALGFSIDEAAELADWVLSAGSPHELEIVQFKTLASAIPNVPEDRLLGIMRVLSQPADRVNSGYSAPHLLSKVTFPRKPIIALRNSPSNDQIQNRAFDLYEKKGGQEGDDLADWLSAERELSFAPSDRFTILNRTWAAPGFLQALIEAIAEHDRSIYQRVGRSLEQLVREIFGSLGAPVASGNYRSRVMNTRGDCDAAIEGDEVIILVESKKEDLSTRAREGSTLDIAIELADSLIKAQLQLARQELILRTHGELVVSGHRIPWNSRRIERVAICLSDHGALHSRTITMSILQSFAGASFGAPGNLDKAQENRLNRLNKNCRSLGEVERQLGTLARGESIPFFNSWFLPLSFVRHLCAISTNVAELVRNLRPLRNMVTGRHDVFADHASLMKLLEKKARARL